MGILDLCPEVLTYEIVSYLFREGRISREDVVSIELSRMVASIDISESEERLALLLSDELLSVDDILLQESGAALSALGLEVDLWLQVCDVRNNWAKLDYPQFYLEDVLEELDLEDRYHVARFFSNDGPSGWDQYQQNIDTAILQNRDRLCANVELK